jgi:hypothetical protein
VTVTAYATAQDADGGLFQLVVSFLGSYQRAKKISC